MKDVITTTVTASEIIPLVKSCLERIKIYRAEKNKEFAKKFAIAYNEKWYNRWFKRSLKTEEETIVYLKAYSKSLYESSWGFSFFPYPCYKFSRQEDIAKKIIDHFNFSLETKFMAQIKMDQVDNPHNPHNPIYTIDIEIYNQLKTAADPKIL